MRERSQAKGRKYQRAVKRWLAGVPLFGVRSRPLGDAYDVTASSASIAGKQFDFSLALDIAEDEDAALIAYVECKFRAGRTPSTASAFDEFARDVVAAYQKANSDEFAAARFLFVATAPPAAWGKFIAEPVAYLRSLGKGQGTPKTDALSQIAASMEILVLRPAILGGTY